MLRDVLKGRRNLFEYKFRCVTFGYAKNLHARMRGREEEM